MSDRAALDDPLPPEEAQAQAQHILQAVHRVIGGPRSLRFPAGRVLEALCLLSGFQAAVTLREVEDLQPSIEEGRRLAAAVPDLPAAVAFRRDAPRQVEGLFTELLFALVTAGLQRQVHTAVVVQALACLVGQVERLVQIPPDELRQLLQAGVERGKPHAAQTQALFERYYVEKRRRRGQRS